MSGPIRLAAAGRWDDAYRACSSASEMTELRRYASWAPGGQVGLAAAHLSAQVERRVRLLMSPEEGFFSRLQLGPLTLSRGGEGVSATWWTWRLCELEPTHETVADQISRDLQGLISRLRRAEHVQVLSERWLGETYAHVMGRQARGLELDMTRGACELRLGTWLPRLVCLRSDRDGATITEEAGGVSLRVPPPRYARLAPGEALRAHAELIIAWLFLPLSPEFSL